MNYTLSSQPMSSAPLLGFYYFSQNRQSWGSAIFPSKLGKQLMHFAYNILYMVFEHPFLYGGVQIIHTR